MSGIVWQRVLEERMPGPPDSGPITAFGEATSEAACVGTSPIMAPLASRTVLRVSGADAHSFLHAQLTADISHMSVAAAQLTAWCTPRGRVIATLHVLRRSEDFLLVVASDLADAVLARLRMFVLRAKVRIDTLHDSVGVLGCAGDAVAGTAHLAASDEQGVALIRTPDPAGGDARVLLVAEPEALAACWDGLSARGVLAVGEWAWNRVLVLAAEPHVSAATRENFIPQMLNLDLLGGVSFDKGCYPGQEIVARTKYLGQLKRRMFVGSSTGSRLPAPGSLLGIPGTEHSAGEVLTSAWTERRGEYDFLAVARIEAARQPLQLAGAVATLRPPPYPLGGD